MKINKDFWKSKTLITTLLIALVTHILPDSKEFITEHPEYVTYIVATVFTWLRIKTNSAIVLKTPKKLS